MWAKCPAFQRYSTGKSQTHVKFCSHALWQAKKPKVRTIRGRISPYNHSLITKTHIPAHAFPKINLPTQPAAHPANRFWPFEYLHDVVVIHGIRTPFGA